MSANAFLGTGAVVAATVDMGTLNAAGGTEQEWEVPHYVLRIPMAAVYKGEELTYSVAASNDIAAISLVSYQASSSPQASVAQADADIMSASLQSRASLVIKDPHIRGNVRTGRAPGITKPIVIPCSTVASLAQSLGSSLGAFMLSHFVCACGRSSVNATDDPSIYLGGHQGAASAVASTNSTLLQALSLSLSTRETVSAVIAAIAQASECMEVEPGDHVLDLSQPWVPQVALKAAMDVTFGYTSYGDDRSVTLMGIPIMVRLTK